MANYGSYEQIVTGVTTYTVDFTDSLPSGGTVLSATATHYPPSGGSTITVTPTVTSPYVYVTFTAPSTTGIHYVDVFATFSDSDKDTARLEIDVIYPSNACRAGMQTIVDTLRLMTDAAPDEFTLAGQRYWTDAHLQTVLDRHVTEFYREEAIPVEQYDGATSTVYKVYWLPFQNIESGTNWELEDSTGATAGTALYTLDNLAGKITFASDTSGTAYYGSGRYYDINLAAADIWRQKAANSAKTFNFSTDNHRVDRGAVFRQYMEMAAYYSSLSGAGSGKIGRDDLA